MQKSSLDYASKLGHDIGMVVNEENAKASGDQKSGRVRSGKARMEQLSPEQRTQFAKEAAKRRWASRETYRNKADVSTDSEILIYQTADRSTRIDVRLDDETVWLTQAQLAELLQTTKQNVSLHLRNIFDEKELQEQSVVKEYLTTAQDGKSYTTKYYNLDVIISVGYRVRSHRGTQFRIWATQRLKEYIVKGFTLDDERLRRGGTQNDYFDELIRRVREIRTSERNFYRKVTDIYATSYDYDKESPITKHFFATVQNKFHYAITHHTAAEIVAERADARKPNMGLTSWDGARIRKSDVGVAKNYLTEDELDSLKLLVDQYLSFAELQAKQRRPMYMKDWISKLDDFLRLNDRDILDNLGTITKSLSDEIAEREYEKYDNKRRLIESETDVSDFDRYVRKIESGRSSRAD